MVFLLSCTQINRAKVIEVIQNTSDNELNYKDYAAVRDRFENSKIKVNDITQDPFYKVVSNNSIDINLAIWIAKRYEEPYLIRDGKKVSFLVIVDEILKSREYKKELSSLAKFYNLEEIRKVSHQKFREDLFIYKWCKSLKEMDKLYQEMLESSKSLIEEKDLLFNNFINAVKVIYSEASIILKELNLNPVAIISKKEVSAKPFLFFTLLLKDSKLFREFPISKKMEKSITSWLVEINVLSNEIYLFWLSNKMTYKEHSYYEEDSDFSDYESEDEYDW